MTATDASAPETRSRPDAPPHPRGDTRPRADDDRSAELTAEERQAVDRAARRVVATEQARSDHDGPAWEMSRHGDGRTPAEIVESVAPFPDERHRWQRMMEAVRARARELRGDDDRPRQRGADVVPPERRRESSARQYGADGGAWRPV